MIKKTICSVFLMCFAIMAYAQTWLNELRKADIIDSIVVIQTDKSWADYLKMNSYHIYYHQPLCHKDPDGEQFQLRATLVTRQAGTLTKRPMQVFISGYGIHDYQWDSPSYYVGQYSINNNYYEIANHLKANVLSLEHRYFKGSLPVNGNLRMEYCNAEEAAADFHALLEVFKKVFTGKYVMTGISKGGTTSFIQHAFYPNDADVYVPYVAPLCDTPSDSRVMSYYKARAWDVELNSRMNEVQRKILVDPNVYDMFSEWVKYYNPTMTEEDLKLEFINNVGLLDFDFHMVGTRQEVRNALDTYDKMKKELMDAGYTESYLMANMAFYAVFDADKCWGWLTSLAKTRATNEMLIPDKAPERLPIAPFSISNADFDDSMTAYYYQAQCELGSFGYDFKSILSGQYSELADSINTLWQQGGSSITVGKKYMKGLEYNPSLRNMVIEKTCNAAKPIIFIFGGDDAWTGGALPDECYNDYTTYKIVLPEQNHNACISKASTDDRKSIWQLIDDALDGKLIDETGITSPIAKHEDTIYNLQGQRVTTTTKGVLYIKNGKKYIAL